MSRTWSRRLARIELALAPVAAAPCFVLVADKATADHQVERLKAAFGEALPQTLFVMIGLATDEPRR